MILVSACLAGEKCRYDGQACASWVLEKLKEKSKALCVCPELMGGLTVPRLPCEIKGGDGQAVLDGRVKVFDSAGTELTKELLAGCYKACQLAKEHRVRLALLKSKSAACGVGKIFDGSFKNKLGSGNGILTALLIKERIRILSEDDFFNPEEFRAIL